MQLTLALPEDDSLAEQQSTMAALLHEQHHWLQSIGTAAGMFNFLLLSVQADIVAAGVPLNRLTPADLPLLRGQFAQVWHLEAWERLECTRRLFWGCRRGDILALQQDGRPAEFGYLTNSLRRCLRGVVEESPTARALLDTVWEVDESKRGAPLQLTGEGWAYGARHILEDAARTNEVYGLAGFGEQLAGDHPALLPLGPAGEPVLDLPTMFSGTYGKARRFFYKQVHTFTHATEIAFAFVCDAALNRPYPPIGPPNGLFVDLAWNPMVYLASLAGQLADFDFEQSVNIFDPGEVRHLIRALNAHLGDPHQSYQRIARQAMSQLLGHLDHRSLADGLFDHATALPVGPTPLGRIRYIMALSAEAFRLRETNPEFFVFPVCHYGADPELFHRLYDPIASPLVRYGDRGIEKPPGRRRGWLDFFLAEAVCQDLLRCLVMFDVDEIAMRIAPYAHTRGGIQHGLAVIERPVRGLFGSAPLAGELMARIEAVALASGLA